MRAKRQPQLPLAPRLICTDCRAELKDLRSTRAKVHRLEAQVSELQEVVARLVAGQSLPIEGSVRRLAVGFDDGRVGVVTLPPCPDPPAPGSKPTEAKFKAILAPPERACEPVSSVAVIPGGRVVVGHDDGRIRLWLLAPAEEGSPTLLADACHTAADRSPLEGCAVMALAHLGGGRVASGAEDHVVCLWSPDLERCEASLDGHSGPVHCCTSLDGDRLATGSGDHTVQVWSLSPGGASRELSLFGHAGAVTTCIPLPGGRILTGSRDETLRLWNVTSGACLSVLSGHMHAVTSAALLAETGLAASASCDGSVRLWRLADGECDGALEGHIDVASGVVDLGGGRLASVSDDGTIRIWALGSRECLLTLQCNATPCALSALV
eukprot:jgi/Tetstr1/435563/TSEL_024466.t1